jgi:hypothetical protein
MTAAAGCRAPSASTQAPPSASPPPAADAPPPVSGRPDALPAPVSSVSTADAAARGTDEEVPSYDPDSPDSGIVKVKMTSKDCFPFETFCLYDPPRASQPNHPGNFPECFDNAGYKGNFDWPNARLFYDLTRRTRVTHPHACCYVYERCK